MARVVFCSYFIAPRNSTHIMNLCITIKQYSTIIYRNIFLEICLLNSYTHNKLSLSITISENKIKAYHWYIKACVFIRYTWMDIFFFQYFQCRCKCLTFTLSLKSLYCLVFVTNVLQKHTINFTFLFNPQLS